MMHPASPAGTTTAFPSGTTTGVCMQAGITLVGSSSLLSGEGSSTHTVSPQKMLLGMGLIIASQVMHCICICLQDMEQSMTNQ